MRLSLQFKRGVDVLGWAHAWAVERCLESIGSFRMILLCMLFVPGCSVGLDEAIHLSFMDPESANPLFSRLCAVELDATFEFKAYSQGLTSSEPRCTADWFPANTSTIDSKRRYCLQHTLRLGYRRLHYLPEGVGHTLTHDTSTSVIVHRAHPQSGPSQMWVASPSCVSYILSCLPLPRNRSN